VKTSSTNRGRKYHADHIFRQKDFEKQPEQQEEENKIAAA